MQNGVEAHVQPKPLFHDGDQHVDRDGDPDLGLHRILGGTIESLDAKMLFDPFEEEFHPPATPVKFCDGLCRKNEVVAKEGQPFLSLSVDVSDASELFRVVL